MRYAASGVSEGARVALTLSDPFCVGRHRSSFLDLIDDPVVVLFAYPPGVMSLFDVGPLDVALDRVLERVELAAIPMGASGSVLIPSGVRVTILADPVARVVV
jgi:hypothetical protein